MSAPPRALVRQACETLATCDEALAKAYEMNGLPEWRSRPPHYETLARLVTYQLLSTRAAGAIWDRVQARLGEVTIETVRSASNDDLRACGLSGPKVEHFRAIADAIASDTLDLERVCRIDPDAARQELLAVRGIGPWTAEVFLLCSAGALDAFPVGDVGLMESHKILLSLDERLTAKSFTSLAENWRPYRGAAAHLLWAHINTVREAEQKDSPMA